MKPFKLIASIVGVLVVLGVAGYMQAQEKRDIPEKVDVGSYELNLLWQKDLRKVFGRELALGSYGDLGPAISMSTEGQYIGVDIHPWDRKTYDLPPGDQRGRFYLLNKEGKILWAKSLGKKQTGIVAKNGSTVLLVVPRDELDIEFFVYDINGKQIGHGRQPSCLELSGNGEYILAFDMMAGHEAALYDKTGKVRWRHAFKNPWGGSAKIMDSGDVVIFDTGDILLKRPNGQVLWHWKSPAHTLLFDLPPDATPEEPNIMVYDFNPHDRAKDKIVLINAKGKIVWETKQGVQTAFFRHFSASRKAMLVAGQEWSTDEQTLWIYDTKKGRLILHQPIATQARLHDMTPDGRLFWVQGYSSGGKDRPGWYFDKQLLLLDVGSFQTTQISSNQFALSPDGSYLTIGQWEGVVSTYAIRQKP